jgi:hypothetical protein
MKRRTKTVIVISLVLLICALSFFVEKILLYSYITYQVFAINEDENPEVFLLPYPDTLSVTRSQCRSLASAEKRVTFKGLSMLVPLNTKANVREKTNPDVLVMSYEDGGIVTLFIDTINKDLFNLKKLSSSNKTDNILEIQKYFKGYTDIDILNFILFATPRNVTFKESGIVAILKYTAIIIKKGIVPHNTVRIRQTDISRNLSSVVLETADTNKNGSIAYIFDRDSNIIYYASFLGFRNSQIDCYLSNLQSLGHSEP